MLIVAVCQVSVMCRQMCVLVGFKTSVMGCCSARYGKETVHSMGGTCSKGCSGFRDDVRYSLNSLS